jgi:hypothetical protein
VERRIKFLNQLIALLFSLYLCWTLIPEHRRKVMLMGAADRTRRMSQALAIRVGRLSLSSEAKGDVTTAHVGYEVAYNLMTQLHDRAVARYEKLRGAS